MQNNIKNVLFLAVHFLEKQNVEYFIFGGIAVGILGYPRFTADVDVVINVREHDIEKFLCAAREAGFAVQVKNHVKRMTESRTLKLKIGDYSVDFVMGETFFDHSAFKRKRKVKLFGENIFLVTREDLILYKLISRRYIDLADIEKIVIKEKRNLDTAYLFKMAGKLSRELDMPRILITLKEMLAKLH